MTEKSREEKDHLERLAEIGKNAAELVHTFRGYLTVIGGFASHIQHAASPEEFNERKLEKIRGDLEIIVKSVNKAEAAILDFRKFSRFYSAEFEIGPHNLNKFLQEKVRLLTDAFRSVKFGFNPADHELQPAFNKTLLEECLLDLVKNAVEAGAENVLIECARTGKEAILRVSNDGEQIPSEMLAKIFRPFVTTKSKGTGLGLANVKTVIEKIHCGKILAESNLVRTVFTIVLPM